MSRGLGKIERAIMAAIENDIKRRGGDPGTVLIRSSQLIDAVYRPTNNKMGWSDWNWKPTPAVRKAVVRAMHSFVRKHQQYALTGGQGRRILFLYDTADPLSAMWAKLSVERRERNPIPRMAAMAALRDQVT